MMDHNHLTIKTFMAITAERDAAIRERNMALEERKRAFAERDMAMLQRDAAMAERNAAIQERDEAIASLRYRDCSMNDNSTIPDSLGNEFTSGGKRIQYQQQQQQQQQQMRLSEAAYSPKGNLRGNDISVAETAETTVKPRRGRQTKDKDGKATKLAKPPRAGKRTAEAVIPKEEFALGRAQELLLILDEYWENHRDLHNVPIYYASPLAKRCMAVYQTYINSMNDRIRNQFASSNPFDFKHISPLKSLDEFRDVGPAVVMASPGGLQSGLSRQLFDKWCSDKRNACVIPGYVVEGTPAKAIINEPKEVTLASGLSAPLNMEVHYISFSAHADYTQTSTFLKELMPPNIILVHGEANEMGRLKQKLLSVFADGNTKIVTPKNCQSVEMHFNSQKMAKTIGKLAEKMPAAGETLSGLLVKKGFTYQIMAPEDLHVFSQLSTGSVIQRITIPYSGAFAVLKHRLNLIYESVEASTDEESGFPALKVHDKVTVKQESENHISLHWTADPISDMVSDSVVALVLNASRELPKLMVESERETNDDEERKKADKIIHALLVSLFGEVKYDDEGKLSINVDGITARLDKQSGEVECENEGLQERVRMAYGRIISAVKPIPPHGF